MNDRKTLKNIPGKRVRRQYFNIPIYMILSMDAAFLSEWTAIAILDAETGFATWWEFTGLLLAVSLVLLLPLAILSVLNRFCFGNVICVLDDKGLHYEAGFIEWRQIKKAVYEPDLPSTYMHRFFYCCNQLCLSVRHFQKEKQIELDHAPFLLLQAVRKHCPGIPCKMSTTGVVWISCLTLGLSFVAVLCVLAA